MKLVFLDIDGTLTPPAGHTIPASALEALKRAKKNGHRLFLCSGRNREMYQPIAAQFPFDGAIGCAGGWIEIDGQPIFDSPLEESVVEHTVQILHDHDFYAVRECLDGSFMDERLTDLLSNPAAVKGKEEWLRWQKTMGEAFGWQPSQNYHGDAVYKLVFIGFDADQMARITELLDPLFRVCVHNAPGEALFNGELIPRAFDKGRAVACICEKLGISLSDTVAFGDSPNDLEMLQTVQLGFAMGNAHPALKAQIPHSCPRFDENGLFKGFEMAGLIE